MKSAAIALRVYVSLDGLILIILGILFWTGNADNLIPVHMLLGITLVIALWALAVLAAFAGVTPGLIAVAAGWGFIVPVLGLAQDRLLPGSLHWLIQVLHLLVGITALALAGILATRITRRQGTPPASRRGRPSRAVETPAR